MNTAGDRSGSRAPDSPLLCEPLPYLPGLRGFPQPHAPDGVDSHPALAAQVPTAPPGCRERPW
eukprot:13823560-Heterocapsa_arctica.AAC.1